MSSISNFISENWKWIGTMLIGAGILYNQFQMLQSDMDTAKRRLQNYIEVIKEQDQTIHELEKRIVVLETT